MSLTIIEQIIMVLIPSIIGLIVSYAFFENSFNYFLYFELIFLSLFVGIGLIETYYLAIVLFILAFITYQAVDPVISKWREGRDEK